MEPERSIAPRGVEANVESEWPLSLSSTGASWIPPRSECGVHRHEDGVAAGATPTAAHRMPLRVFHSVLEPAGPQAASITWLWWITLAICAAVFVIVLGALGAAMVRSWMRRRDASASGDASMLGAAVAAGVGLTVVILFGLLVADVRAHRIMSSFGAASAVSIAVTGHQWWWEIEYEDATPSRRLKTANEIHIPIGRPVVFKFASHDVIHSFWAPNLQGKRDLVPGIASAIWLQADRPGIYRGQCAEFCGRQHAHMAFDIVAEPDADFERWLDAGRASAREPQGEEAMRGRAVFLARQCAFCHTIRGTGASGSIGPDLTHLASRGTIAAGTLPNSRGHLAGWIVNSQTIKPGNQMPPNPLEAGDLQALLAYLEELR